MIELPDLPGPNGVEPAFIDYGLTLRGALGGESLRLNRPGGRFRISVSFPPMTSETARLFINRLLRGRSEGLRMPYPLLDTAQDGAGNPVVDGAGQAGTTISLRGFTPGYQVKEGFWFSIENANGRHHLHTVGANVAADASGQADVPIAPALRFPFADGDQAHFAVPMIEGLVVDDQTRWQVPVNRLFAVQFQLEEVA